MEFRNKSNSEIKLLNDINSKEEKGKIEIHEKNEDFFDEECGENIVVEKLNYHKLNVCKNKKKFRQCKKCKEAIRFDLYDLHINKNKCNIAKDDMNRCPLCHHDIEKSNEGFYQHLVVDGCAYQNY